MEPLFLSKFKNNWIRKQTGENSKSVRATKLVIQNLKDTEFEKHFNRTKLHLMNW